MTEPGEPAQLEYAPRLPALRSRRLRQWGLWAVLVSLVAGGVLFAPKVVNYVLLLQHQRQCLTYTAPAAEVVFETDRAEAKRLRLSDARYVADANGHGAFLIPQAWTAYHLPLGGGFPSSGTAFLHERTTPQGVRYLVAVDVNVIPLPSGVTVAASRIASFGARIIRPGTAFRGPRSGRSVTLGDGARIQFNSDERLTIFAGQPDPIDSSHFTIDYDLNGARHTIDGWLVDDETVIIESRD